MKSTAELLILKAILSDVGIATGTSIDRDWLTIQSRFEHEGQSFITITLPSFAKDFERCLEQGYADSQLFRSFSKLRTSPSIPRFLSGMMTRVFESCGALRKSPCLASIDGIRQICLAFNKLKMECNDARKAQAIRNFISCEIDVRSFRPDLWPHLGLFDRVVRLAFGSMLHSLESQLQRTELVPKHGPGAVFERLTTEDKYRRKVWSRRLDRSFPPVDFLYTNAEDFLQSEDGRALSYSEDIDHVRVIFVPKTMKTPRVIAIEPTYNQYCQQAIARPMMAGIESDKLLGQAIHFTDSSFNGRAALESSLTRTHATLDMSEASDRVSARLAYRFVRDYPDLARAIFSCRTKYALLPNMETIPLAKFASMGSALCFPMESCMFYIMTIMGLLRARSLSATARNIASLTREIHVFGDDLIVPVDAVDSVVDTLHSAAFKVNQKKSFSSGCFRESCGVDAYMGVNVTPVYIRQLPPRRRRDAKKILSYVASANLFYKKGYWNTARYMRSLLESLTGSLPHTRDESTCLGWYSFLGTYSAERWNRFLHRWEILGLVPKVTKVEDSLDGYDRLLERFLNSSEQLSLFSEPQKYSSSVIRDSVRLKRTWNTPF